MSELPFDEAPVIETARLRLRHHRMDDLDAYAALLADPVVTRYVGGRPFTREEAWTRIIRYIGMWKLLGYGFWIVEERETERLVGATGFHELKRDISPAFEGEPEAGWMFSPDVHGRGYASECVAAIHEWGDRNFPGSTTVCIIHPENAASLRVAEKFGYREVARTEYADAPTVILRRQRRSAAAAAG
ncbi:GNAT family N-acetyltransferase [Mesorhizobium xinjiangense]|uniref:GNAT family N-acetyltransferase n=1 Tax=Mesorhizobium xinjiangense TaxID=2678685 RepID=UPI0012ED73CF|nr:GNAT family N-acetyltransferase [Mesorhizobium xinjiangense]